MALDGPLYSCDVCGRLTALHGARGAFCSDLHARQIEDDYWARLAGESQVTTME